MVMIIMILRREREYEEVRGSEEKSVHSELVAISKKKSLAWRG